MTNTAIDLSKVPHLEARRSLAKLFAEDDEVRAERAAAVEGPEERLNRLGEELRERYNNEFEVQAQPIRDEIAALAKPFDDRITAIGEACEAVEGPSVDWVDDHSADDEGPETPNRCALSGLIILQGDDVLSRDDGAVVLACVLPWPETQALPDAAE